ncbi:hypothetical protein [Paraburkholderia lacunae]|uniref:hypothetical protein n=1 Tax=Paraburkholderia lacunae TaxID=2211104 RepID=UPI0010583F60|nr:hypothetical protein [Paraburkholderia lacunae]
MKAWVAAFAGCETEQPGANGVPAQSRRADMPLEYRMTDAKSSVAPAIRIQMDTSFVADLIHNIQYDSRRPQGASNNPTPKTAMAAK